MNLVAFLEHSGVFGAHFASHWGHVGVFVSHFWVPGWLLDDRLGPRVVF